MAIRVALATAALAACVGSASAAVHVPPAVTGVTDPAGTWVLLAAQDVSHGWWPMSVGTTPDTIVNPGLPDSDNYADVAVVLGALAGDTRNYELLLHCTYTTGLDGAVWGVPGGTSCC